MTSRLWLVAALLPFALAGCGDSDESLSADDSAIEIDGEDAEEFMDAVEDAPACEDVWVPGQTLPEDYDGCVKGDTIVAHVYFDCTDGEILASYEDRLWVVTPGEIQDAGGDTASDAAYGKAYDACVS